VTGRLSDGGGYTLIELLVVMALLTVVVGGIVTLFASGLNSEADQNRRFQAQQDGRLALDKLRREVHGACTISTPSTYNTAVSSVTIYFPSDNCASGSHSVTWCTTGGSGRYALYRIDATSCAGATMKFADYLTSGTIFTYLPPSSHLVTSTSLGQGTGSGAIVTQDLASTLPRLHVDINLQLRGGLADGYRLVDDIAFRNGPRACAGGTASC
jgi:prepilin-type N-terminal cleavage/methylation domain-containing protein